MPTRSCARSLWFVTLITFCAASPVTLSLVSWSSLLSFGLHLQVFLGALSVLNKPSFGRTFLVMFCIVGSVSCWACAIKGEPQPYVMLGHKVQANILCTTFNYSCDKQSGGVWNDFQKDVSTCLGQTCWHVGITHGVEAATRSLRSAAVDTKPRTSMSPLDCFKLQMFCPITFFVLQACVCLHYLPRQLTILPFQSSKRRPSAWFKLKFPSFHTGMVDA